MLKNFRFERLFIQLKLLINMTAATEIITSSYLIKNNYLFTAIQYLMNHLHHAWTSAVHERQQNDRVYQWQSNDTRTRERSSEIDGLY